ncbi:hypothetical protein [Planctellipticum variicoloris]|uniref:hypothetical protein n=1 Tax=Planctellipticum variicoloris TaxID=3064265 RepID=UPI003013738C|nr:hypothetical protein SH412_001396 [Planctomycetaceae bacterium SH412]
MKFSIAVLAMVVGLAHPASAQTDRRLLQKTSLDFDNATIGDVLKDLAERHKLTLALSPKVTERECDQKKVMVHVAGTTLGSALNRLRAVSPLVFAVDRGELKVVLQEEDDERLYPIRYPTIGWGPLVEDVDSLKSGLMGVTGLRWKEIDGRGGSIGDLTPQGLVIEQSSRGHSEIRQLVADLAVHARGRKPIPTAADRVGLRIADALRGPLDSPAREIPLVEFLKQVLGEQKLGWQIDVNALNDEGIELDKVLLKHPGDKRARYSMLDEALKSHGLARWAVEEVEFVTTQARADQTTTARIYQVGHRLDGMNTMTALMQQLQNNPELGSWEQVDGEGGFMFPLGHLLVIRQTAAVHGRLPQLLQ